MTPRAAARQLRSPRCANARRALAPSLSIRPSGWRTAILTSVACAALLARSGPSLAATSGTLTTFFNEDVNPNGVGILSSTPNSNQARSDFFSSLTGVGTETFESIKTGTVNPVITFPGAGTATLNGIGEVESGPSSSDQYPISGTQYYNAGTGSFTVTFSQPIAAFGFYGTDIGDVNGQLTLTLTKAGGGTTLLTVPNVLGPTADGSALYYGFYDRTVQYTGIFFGNTSTGDVFGFDDFSVGSVGQIIPTINTTGGDLAANVFSLSSAAANHSPVVFQGGTLQMSGGSFPNNIISAPVTLTLTNGTVDTGPASGGFSGVVSGPGSLTVIGSHTFTLTGANTYSGGTFLDGGTLAVGNNTALGTGALTFGGGTLQGTSGMTVTLANPMQVTAAGGTIDSNNGGLVLAGTVSGPGGLAFAYTGGSYTGTVLDDTSTVLTATNTYTGGSVVKTNAQVQTRADNALGTGSLEVDQNGELALSGVRQDVTVLTGAGRILAAGSRSGATNSITISTLTVQSGNFSGELRSGDYFTTDSIGARTTVDYGDFDLVKVSDGSATGGTLTLSSTISNYGLRGGRTLLQGGTIAVGGDQALGLSTLLMSDGTTLTETVPASLANAVVLAGTDIIEAKATAGLSLSGTISGTGLLRKTGDGALTLLGASSFSGGTEVTSGTLLVGNSAALGSGTLTLDPGTTLGFTTAGLTIPNAVNLPASDPVIDTGGNFETLSGSITGAGFLTKLGSGTLDLTGNNTYTGATEVAAGTLLVDGTVLNSVVTVDSGAVLGGGGTVLSLIAQSGSTVMPGGNKALTVTGDASFAAGSTYSVTVNPDGTSNSLTVGGKAAIAGANLSILAGSGTFGAKTYTLLSAANGVTGTFANVSTAATLALLHPSVGYAADDVTLTLQPVNFTSIATTPNQTAVAAAIQALGPGNAPYDAVLNQNAAGAQQAFASASGVSHADPVAIVSNNTRVMTALVVDRLWDVTGTGLSAKQVIDQFAPDAGLPALVRCYGPVPDPVPAAPQRSYTAWGEAFGSFGHNNATANAGALDRSLGGFILGLDSPFDHVLGTSWRIGVAGGYTDTTFRSPLDGGSGTVQNVFGSLYGGARYGAVDVRVGATVGGTFTDSRRTVAFPGFLETERAFNRGITAQAFGEVGYRFTNGSAVLEPVVGASILHLHQDGFRETGGAAALVVASQDTDLGTTSLGFRGEVAPLKDVPLLLHGFLAWQHTIGNVSPATTLAFESNSSQSFSVSGAPIDRDALAAEAALDYRLSAAMDVGLTYTGLVGPTAQDHSVKGRVEYRF